MQESKSRWEEGPPEEVSIPSGDVTLAGFFYDNPSDGNCAVLLLHGYTSTRYGVLQYAPLFWKRGCDLLAYDARGHGASGHAFHTFGYYEKQDGVMAYAWLLDRTGLEPSQVGVMGVSYGAATALQMLPLRLDIAFVVADSSYQDLRSIIAYQAVKQFGTWVKIFFPGALFLVELRANIDVDKVSPFDAVKGSETPILLIHALEDDFTPASQSEGIFANSSQGTTQLHLTDWGARHAGSIYADYEAFDRIVDSFLAEQVPDF